MNEDEDRANRVLRIIALIIAIGIILVTFVVGGFYSIYLLAEGGIYSVSLFVLALLVLEIIVTVKLKKRQPLASGILFTFLGGVNIISPNVNLEWFAFMVANLVCGGLAIAYWWRTRKVKEQIDTEI